MRILMLADFPPALVRGTESRDLWKRYFLPTPVLNLLEGLARVPDIEIYVLSFSRDSAAKGTFCQRIHVEVVQVPKGSGLGTLYLLRKPLVLKATETYRPDIVHGQGIEAGYAWLATLQPYPHLLTFHGVYGVTAYLKPQGIWQKLGHMLQRATLRRAQHIVAISHYLEDWFCRNTQANIYYIPNAVHDSFYQIKLTKRAGFDLLYVGRITPAKGLHDAIEALAQLEKAGIRGIKMAVVGRPTGSGSEDYLKQCHRRANTLEYTKISFLGSLEELCDIFSVSKLLILPSYEESFSMVAAEASAAGLPVIAYRTGGIPTVVEHGETGFLVSPGDIQSLSDAIAKLLSNERIYLRFARAAKERAMSWHQDIVAKQTAELYAKIIKSKF